jgi:hypothetical protein
MEKLTLEHSGIYIYHLILQSDSMVVFHILKSDLLK